MDFLCDIAKWSSEIFYSYDHILRLLYLPESIILNNSDFFTNNIFSVAIVSTLSEHWWMSYLYFWGPFWNTELRHNSTVFYWISFYIFWILLWFILDLIFYFLWKYLSNKSIFKNLKFNSKKFFYIFLDLYL